MQYLSKRFYHMFVPRMIKTVAIKPTLDEFLFSMHKDEQQVRVMVFYRQPFFYLMSPTTNYRWVEKPIIVKDE